MRRAGPIALCLLFACGGSDQQAAGEASASPEPAATETGEAPEPEELEEPEEPEQPEEPEGPTEAERITAGEWVEIRKGQSLSKIAQKTGLSGKEAYRLTMALSEHMDVEKIKIGQRWRSRKQADPDAPDLEFELSTTQRVAATNGDDGWTAELVEVATVKEPILVSGEIRSSLWKAVEDAGQDPALVATIADAFAYDIDFHAQTRKGDRFALVVERELLEDDGSFVGYGQVLAAAYAGTSAGDHRLYWWDPPGKRPPAYFDAEGQGVTRSFLKSPLKFSRVSSDFDPKRMHPILHREKGHMGTDYAAPEGTPIWAAADGKIAFRKMGKGAGNMVIIDHGNGLVTLYMHLSAFEEGQKVGTRVKQKDVIGYVGMTGLATGPHLHFGVKKHGKYVDPMSVDRARAPGVKKKNRDKFEKEIRPYIQQLDEAMAVDEPEPEALEDTEGDPVPEDDAPAVDTDGADTDG